MGIETSPPDVEESTEPPLRPSSATAAEGNPGLVRDRSSIAGSHSSQNKNQLNEKDLITSASTPTATTASIGQLTGGKETPATDPLDWGEEYKYAHTFSTDQISNVLAVNIQ